MTALDYLIALESYQEILEVLTPTQLAVVALRVAHDLSPAEMARELGVSTQAISSRFVGAGKAVERAYPDRAYVGRQKRRYMASEREMQERALLAAMAEIERAGEVPTLAKIRWLLGKSSTNTQAIFNRAQDRGWVARGERAGNLWPVGLTAEGRAALARDRG